MTPILADDVGAVPAAVVERIRRARSVLAIGHENPDADTLGSSIAIAMIVEALGGRATIACTDPPPPIYDFLPLVDGVRTDPDPTRQYDLVVLSDTATVDRIGAIGERNATLLAELPRVVIDHHVSNDEVGPSDWVDPHAAATCELTALLALALGVPLDHRDGALATALMAGIVMDTATFAHPNATPRTLRVASALVAAGAPLSDISRRLYRTKPEAQLRLYGRVLDRLAVAAEGRVVWSTLRDGDLDATGAIAAHSEGIIDLLTQAEEAEVAILFKDAGERTRLSVRTKPGGVDATVLTGEFGGGGHARAAGATVDLHLDDAIPAVLATATRLAADVRR
ncbi:MAG TPA: DHH family phosphoesterase [Candidatus Limnocylindrales bacterium]